jgi:thiamine biosynthesis lipoprotein
MLLIHEAVQKQTLFRRVLRLMGNRFEFTVVAPDEEEGWANNCIDAAIAEVNRIESLLTTFKEYSQTNHINRNAGIKPVRVDREVFNLISRSLKISDLTQGAFDITYGSIDKKLWNFDTTMTELPDPETAKKMVRLINYKNILLDEKAGTVFLRKKGMRIGFGGIGKGYAAERAKYILRSNGVENGIVNAAGDLTTWGLQPDGKPWTIGIAQPNQTNTPFSYLNISDMAIATSGNYEKFVSINNKRYSHTIDPKTGLPVTGIQSVTIISPNAEIADAMATPVMVMGIEVGLNLINQLKNIECIMIDEKNRIFTSKNIHIQ